MTVWRHLGSSAPLLVVAVALSIAVGCDEPGDGPFRGVPDGSEMGIDAGPPDLGPEPDTGPPAGSENGACRADEPRCDGSLVCDTGRCVTPPDEGRLDGPCRAEAPECDAGFACVDGVCQPDEGCVNTCRYGETECVAEYGFQVCGGTLDPENLCNAFGSDPEQPVVVACDPDRVCESGVCAPIEGADAPIHPEVLLIVDRGAIPDPQWPSWRAGLLEWAGSVQPSIGVALRLFPGEEACSVGPEASVTRLGLDGFEAALDAATGGDDRPLEAAMTRIGQVLDPANEGQYIVLLTGGAETCVDASETLRRLRFLRGRGIRVRVVRLAFAAVEVDAALDELGRSGGLAGDTSPAYAQVDSVDGLRAELERLAEVVIQPPCGDQDGDGYGPFCALGPDCAPNDGDSNAGSPERCDGRDNDCDDAVDEVADLIDVPEAERSEGLCLGLTQVCEAGLWFEPNYAEVEGYEHRREITCDGQDNDCDGLADEALGRQFGECIVGTGACAATGTWRCDPASPDRSVCDAVEGDPSPEVCDGVDNDCNGEVDDGAPVGGVELCDGRDNDCDDAIDEAPDLGACVVDIDGTAAVGCFAGQCVVGCAEGLRNAGGDPDCESPGYAGITLGDGFTCLIDPVSGLAECYGVDEAPLPPVGDVVDMAAGGAHACVLFGGAEAGAVACVGPDDAITTVDDALRATALSVGERIACALADGDVRCWSPDAASAGTFDRNRDIVEISAGARHVCARDVAGAVRCHGACGAGCEGQGEAPDEPFAALSAGLAHTCGITPSGAIRCWGAGSVPCGAQFCDLQQRQAIPPAGDGYQAIAASALHTCAIDAAFELECWGSDEDGRASPPAGHFGAIWAGDDHTCARRLDGRVRCWGLDRSGETAPLD